MLMIAQLRTRGLEEGRMVTVFITTKPMCHLPRGSCPSSRGGFTSYPDRHPGHGSYPGRCRLVRTMLTAAECAAP